MPLSQYVGADGGAGRGAGGGAEAGRGDLIRLRPNTKFDKDLADIIFRFCLTIIYKRIILNATQFRQ